MRRIRGHSYILLQCLDCKRVRWVRKDKPAKRCVQCANTKFKSKFKSKKG